MVGNRLDLRILIITSEPYPIGFAATNRIRTYAKGLSELDQNVEIISLKPLYNGDNHSGTIDGYKYVNFNNIFKYKKILFFNILNTIFGFTISIIYIIKKKSKSDVIIMVTNKPLYLFAFSLVSKIIRAKYVQEKSEFPFVLNCKTVIGKIYSSLYINSVYKIFDAMILMTNSLKDYFNNHVTNKCKLQIIPMTVEIERFSIKHKPPIKGDYIAYCGFMGGNKDGVNNLIDSFSKIVDAFHNIKLVLIGDGPTKEIDKLKSQVNNLSLNEKVVFTGRIERDNIPSYLSNAKILALARPSSLQSTGGFPTKLGEYLSTGKPVIVTKVGEIPDYLTDNVNAFLVPADNNFAFAKRMKYVLKNYEEALSVGKMGFQVAMRSFNYKIQSKNILNFLENLIND